MDWRVGRDGVFVHFGRRIGGAGKVSMLGSAASAHRRPSYIPSRKRENINQILVDSFGNLNSIEVSLVWDPKWHKDLMSEEAKLALDIF